MKQQLDVDQARHHLVCRINQQFSEQLKDLLETHHLYQKVTIDAVRITQEIRDSIAIGVRQLQFDCFAKEFFAAPFTPSDEQLFVVVGGLPTPKPAPVLLIGNIKLFCSKCDGRETFSPLWHVDVVDELLKLPPQPRVQPPPSCFQLFLLLYQCQVCHGAPEAFLIRRQGWQLILEGRSPMEYAEVAAFIPKVERPFFRDAVVAMHGGKTLAALFYLRTFLEQFARRQTGISGRSTGEEMMDAYTKRLPASLRDQMPSLGEWYERLSEAVHEARQDEELFEKAKAAIENHFDIRRVFRIPDGPPPPAQPECESAGESPRL
jgi:hypothetical protein